MQNDFWIEGIVPAVFTPLQSNGDLNLTKVSEIVDHLAVQGITALYVCGATGEGPHLTEAERMAVAEAYRQTTEGRMRLIVQVGHNSLRQARILATHAADIGADAISATPPHFFRMTSEEILLESLAEISAGAPELPLYYYHIPRLTGVTVNLYRLLQLAAEHLPTLRGVKYSDFTIFELQACVESSDRKFNILFGSDEMLLSGLVGGAQGAVGTTYCFAAPLYLRLFQAFRDGDLTTARQAQSKSVRLVRLIERYAGPAGNLPAMKAVMKLIGLDCGPLRLPLPTLSETAVKGLQKLLEQEGFLRNGELIL